MGSECGRGVRPWARSSGVQRAITSLRGRPCLYVMPYAPTRCRTPGNPPKCMRPNPDKIGLPKTPCLIISGQFGPRFSDGLMPYSGQNCPATYRPDLSGHHWWPGPRSVTDYLLPRLWRGLYSVCDVINRQSTLVMGLYSGTYDAILGFRALNAD